MHNDVFDVKCIIYGYDQKTYADLAKDMANPRYCAGESARKLDAWKRQLKPYLVDRNSPEANMIPELKLRSGRN